MVVFYSVDFGHLFVMLLLSKSSPNFEPFKKKLKESFIFNKHKVFFKG